MDTSVRNKEHRLATGAAERLRSSKYAVAITVASVLLYILLAAYQTAPYGHNLSSLIRVGASNPFYFPSVLDKGTVVFTDPKNGGDGYDGQFYLYMIKDFFMGQGGIPNPFRFQRILYPALVYAVALGRADLIPLSMLLVNLLAIALSTLLLWKLISGTTAFFENSPGFRSRDNPLDRTGLRPEYLLVYSLNVGFLVAVFYDVATPLCIGLVVASAYFFARGRLWLASAMMALSLLAQENGMVVLGAMGLWVLLRGFIGAGVGKDFGAASSLHPTRQSETLPSSARLKENLRGAGILGLAVVPWAVWQLFLWGRYGNLPVLMSGRHFRLPFVGMISEAASFHLTANWSDNLRELSVYPMMLFVLVLLVVAAVEMKKRPSAFVLVLLVHGLIGVSFNREQIWSSTITSSARALAGVFPFVVICYAQNRSRRLLLLIALSVLLTLMGVARIFLVPSHPFVVV